MKILLTGASGLVGGAFARAAARKGFEVTGVVGRFTGPIEGLRERIAAELTEEAEVKRVFAQVRPDAVVNCAAVSEPGACDADPERSGAMNVTLPALLAEQAEKLGARLLHLSSEQAFDGARTTPYSVRDAVAPINLYGQQKVASERAVLAAAPSRAAVVRAPLLMGNSPSGKRSLHERLLADWAAGRVARLFVDEYRQPCTAANLAEVLLELVERPELCGVFHWAGVDFVSRYEIGLRIRDHFRLPEQVAPIATVSRANVPDAAKSRPACLALDLEPLVSALKSRPETLAEQLATLDVPESVQTWYHSV